MKNPDTETLEKISIICPIVAFVILFAMRVLGIFPSEVVDANTLLWIGFTFLILSLTLLNGYIFKHTQNFEKHCDILYRNISVIIEQLKSQNVRIGKLKDPWKWEPKKGILWVGNERYVVLRQKTIEQLLCEREKHDTKGLIRKNVYDIGLDFGKELVKVLQNEPESIDLLSMNKAERLLKWSFWDADAGLGKFDTSRVSFSEDETRIDGIIRYKYPFICSEKTEGTERCTMIEGYIEGVLKSILGLDTIVETEICQARSNVNHCEFSVINKRS